MFTNKISCGILTKQEQPMRGSDKQLQITKKHLTFLEEAKNTFEDDFRMETWRNKESDLIALRYGADRDCIKIYELGDEVGFFANIMITAPQLTLHKE